MLSRANITVYSALLEALGSPNRMINPVRSRPPTTRFARPQRSAKPAASDANAPSAFPITSTNTNCVNVNPKWEMILVATAPWMYSS